MNEEHRPLEKWPEDEGSAPHARPEFPRIGRLLLRAAPRVVLAMLLAFLYTSAEGATALAFLLSWLVVVGSMLMPRWRRYVETGERGPRRASTARPPERGDGEPPASATDGPGEPGPSD